MVKIYVIDNGGQWTHREWRTLRDLGVETKIIPNTTNYDEIVKERISGLVLSGGAPRIGLKGTLGNCSTYLEKANFPILGICAGHQFMARFFGGNAQPCKTPEFGKVEIKIIKKDPLFKGIPEKSVVWESHNDEVTKVPVDFEVIAESEYCKVQAMSHKNKPFYGLQFHPEVEHTEFGEIIFKNYIKICENVKF